MYITNSTIAHEEGLHAKLSGGHFLKALSSPRGSEGFQASVRNLVPCMAAYVQHQTPDAKQLCLAVIGQFPMAIGLRKGTKMLLRAGKYNSQDIGRLLQTWAEHFGFVQYTGLDEKGFQTFMRQAQPTQLWSYNNMISCFFSSLQNVTIVSRCQHGGMSVAKQFGINSAKDFEDLRQARVITKIAIDFCNAPSYGMI